jgi:hypothetical protein
MNRLTTLSLTGLAVLSFAMALPAGDAIAQQKQQVSYKTPAENSKYVQQHAIDVGDVPGHQVRVYELHRTFPTNAPVINEIKLKEVWSRNTSDYVDGNGPGTFYSVYMLENGDKFFARGTVVTQRTAEGKLSSMTAGTITGGTGKFAGMRGVIRSSNTADPKAGFNDGQSEIEYWVEK